jgi:hypothetical protein
MTRRGKGGKPRLMTATLSIPIFHVDHKGFAKLMPSDGMRKYYVHVERHRPMAENILEMTDLDFLGYAVALSKRVKHMSDQCQHKKWPGAKSNPINVLKRLPDFFEEDPEKYCEKYGNPDFRNTFVEEIRRLTSSLVRMHLQLDLTRAHAELNAAEFLLFTNKGEFIPKGAKDKENEYEFTKDNDLLTRTIKYHESLKKEIEKLHQSKKKK